MTRFVEVREKKNFRLKKKLFFFKARLIINTGKVLLFVGSSRCEGLEIVGCKKNGLKVDWMSYEWILVGLDYNGAANKVFRWPHTFSNWTVFQQPTVLSILTTIMANP